MSLDKNFQSEDQREIDMMIINHMMDYAPIFETPWGFIYKSEVINRYFQNHLARLRKEYYCDRTESISIGKMEPRAFHKPFIRNCERSIGDGARTLYVVLEGSIKYVEDDEIKIAFPGDTVMIPANHLFAFEAGLDGCKFGIIMTPEYEEDQFLNEIL